MKKVVSLYATSEKDLSSMNIFEKEQLAEELYTISGNGANKLKSTGNSFVDDFASIGAYKNPRDIEDIFATMDKLWSIDPLTTLKESFYLRIISRDIKLIDNTILKRQKGQGLKYEFITRMYWLAVNHPETFAKNASLVVTAGSWNDLFQLLRMDLEYNGIHTKLNWSTIISIIVTGLRDANQSNLIKKYLPQIKSSTHCKTLRNQCNNFIAKKIAKSMFTGNEASIYRQYRKMKSSGTAHQWQQAISEGRYSDIDWGKVAGRALTQLTSTKFLTNHNLVEDYKNWLIKQPSAKYTGYVYELFKKDNPSELDEILINKQFKTLLDSPIDSNLICCLDTSGSMEAQVPGTSLSAMTVAKAMGVYFSYFLKGKFQNTFLEFDTKTHINRWVGKTPCDKFYCTPTNGWCGSTNFLSVADCLIRLYKGGYGKIEDFPNGVLCISDGEFDPDRRSFYRENYDRASTFMLFKQKLLDAGFPQEYVDNFKMILWDIPNGFYGERTTPKFEALADAKNIFYMSGFDPSGLSFLFNKTAPEKPLPRTAEELFEAAMSQDLLNLLNI